MEERERRRAIVAAAAALAQRETEMAPVKTDEIGTSAATLAAILQTSALEKVVAGEEVVGSDSVVATDVPTAAFTTGKNCVMRRSIIDVEIVLYWLRLNSLPLFSAWLIACLIGFKF